MRNEALRSVSLPCKRARALAGLDPIAVGLARERELKLFFIKGHAPEDAAR